MTSHHHASHPYRNGLTNGLISKAGKKRRTSDDLPLGIGDYVPVWQESCNPGSITISRPLDSSLWLQVWRKAVGMLRGMLRAWRPKDIVGTQLLLIIIWIIVLWWGEEVVFRRKVEDCSWDRWESWPTTSAPHHVVLVADPQLVDPHTYPGRPWPLSTLTVRYTDLYMRKCFQQIQNILVPESIFFLGDLFDGGREWSTGAGDGEEGFNQDKRWTKYNSKFWLQEYRRFSRIFINPWLRSQAQGRQGRHGNRKLVAELPGNHDLGLGNGIRIPVRKRFQAYFGDGNRIDIVGNHTFVSLDTVSLSAKGQFNPATGSPGNFEIHEGQAHSEDIWEPVEHFLHTAKMQKSRAISRELRVRYGLPENEIQDHGTFELDDSSAHTVPVESEGDTDVPSVVLTHVPLYRDPGTPCGPLRERFPPSKVVGGSSEPPVKDDANSIHVQAGEQYQNVLTPEVSTEIIDLVGDVSHVFSGDDHDYCELVHRGYTSKNGGIKEITVKSISWAMGVRKPGVVLLSLWNPIDQDGKKTITSGSTIQSHLCLLPDQLSIFIRYGWLLGFTILVLLFRAFGIAFNVGAPTKQPNSQLLPHTRPQSTPPGEQEMISSSTRSSPPQDGLAVRSSAGKPRSVSPFSDYGYGRPSGQASPRRMDDNDHESREGTTIGRGWKDVALDRIVVQKQIGKFLGVYDEFRSSMLRMASFVLLWYVWLLWNS